MDSLEPKHMGRAWLVFFIFFFAALFISGNNDKIAATMVLLMSDMNMSAAATGLLITVAAVIGGIAAIPIGAAMVKTGPRVMGIIAILLALAGCIIGALASNYGFLMFSRIFDGTAIGVIAVVVPSMVSAWFPEEKRSLPMGIWTCWVSLGYIAVLFGANFLADEAQPHTWVNVWWGLAVVFIAVLFLVVLFGRIPQSMAVEKEEGPKISMKEGFKSVPALCCGLIMFFLAIIVVIFSSFAPTYCNLGLGLDMAMSNSLTSLISVGMIVGGVLMGAVLLKVKNKYRIFIIAAVLTGLISVASFLFPANIAAVYMFAFGFFAQCVMATLFTIAPEASSSPAMVPITMGFITFGQLMAGLAVTVAGLVIDAAGFAVLSYATGAVGILLIIMVAIFAAIMKKREVTDKNPLISEMHKN